MLIRIVNFQYYRHFGTNCFVIKQVEMVGKIAKIWFCVGTREIEVSGVLCP